MDVRIGVIHTAKEIDVELPDDADRDALKTAIDEALADDDDDAVAHRPPRPRGRRARRQDRLHRARQPRQRAPHRLRRG